MGQMVLVDLVRRHVANPRAKADAERPRAEWTQSAAGRFLKLGDGQLKQLTNG